MTLPRLTCVSVPGSQSAASRAAGALRLSRPRHPGPVAALSMVGSVREATATFLAGTGVRVPLRRGRAPLADGAAPYDISEDVCRAQEPAAREAVDRAKLCGAA